MIANSNFRGTSVFLLDLLMKSIKWIRGKSEKKKNTCHSSFFYQERNHSFWYWENPWNSIRLPNPLHLCQHTKKIHLPEACTQRHSTWLVSEQKRSFFLDKRYLLWKGFVRTFFFWSKPRIKQRSEFDISIDKNNGYFAHQCKSFLHFLKI